MVDPSRHISVQLRSRSTVPRHIRFDPRLDGRFYEEFADGSQYTIGRIVGWEPPELLSYTWKAPEWASETTITVGFTEGDGRTRVEVAHSGLDAMGMSHLGEGYAVGLREILGGLKAWVQDKTN